MSSDSHWPEASAARQMRIRRVGSEVDEPICGGRFYGLVSSGGLEWIDLECEAREHELRLAIAELHLSNGHIGGMSQQIGGDPDGDFWAVSCEGLGRMLQYVRIALRWERIAFGGRLYYDPALWLRIWTDAPLYCYQWHYYGRRPAGRPARREIRAILDAWAQAGGDQSIRLFNAFLFRHLGVSHIRFMKSEMVRPLLKAIRTTQAGRLEQPAPVNPTKGPKVAKGKPKASRRASRSPSPKVVPLFRERPAPSPSFGPYDGAA